jgi:hypothetical protein
MPRTIRSDVDGKIYELMRFIVRCNICNDSIESISQDELIKCVCKNLMIRGGVEGDRFIFCLHDLITDLSKWKLIE